MRRMRSVSFALVLAIVALGVTALSAQAEPVPRWLSNGKEIGSNPVTVKTGGTLTFDLTQFGTTVTCKVVDTELIWNPSTVGGVLPGRDQITKFKVSRCTELGPAPLCATKMEVIAHGLPWASQLIVEPPVRDVIEGIQLEFKCNKGKSFGIFTGTLAPKVGNSVLEFEGVDQLHGEFGVVTVKGNDKLTGPLGDRKITAS